MNEIFIGWFIGSLIKLMLFTTTFQSYHGCQLTYLCVFWLSEIDWLGFNFIFNKFSVISRQPVHLLICFLFFSHQYSTQHTFQANGCFTTLTVSPLVKDKWRLSQWLLSNSGKNVGQAGIQTHNPWIDSPHR